MIYLRDTAASYAAVANESASRNEISPLRPDACKNWLKFWKSEIDFRCLFFSRIGTVISGDEKRDEFNEQTGRPSNRKNHSPDAERRINRRARRRDPVVEKSVSRARPRTANIFARKVLAVLQTDLSPNRAAFGERSASVSAARQMLFSADENAVDLRISKTGKKLKMRGQILGEGFARCAIKLTGENASFETRADELSEFSFSEIPSGRYDLILRSGESEILVKSLELI